MQHSLDEIAGPFVREALFPSSRQVCNTNKSTLNKPPRALQRGNVPSVSSERARLPRTWADHVSGVNRFTRAWMEPSGAASFITARKTDTCYRAVIQQQQEACRARKVASAGHFAHLIKKTLPSLQTPYDQWSGRVSRPRGAAMISLLRLGSAPSPPLPLSPQTFSREPE